MDCYQIADILLRVEWENEENFRSNFDKNALDLSIKNVKSMIGHINVYESTCTVSEKAVSTLEKEIMRI